MQSNGLTAALALIGRRFIGGFGTRQHRPRGRVMRRHGQRERERRIRQIEAGSLRSENGLRG